MSADELVRHSTNALFVIVFAGSAVTAARERTRPAIDAAVFFGLLASVIVLSQAAQLFGITFPPLVSDVMIVLILALPYVFMRLVDDLAGVPRAVMRVALGGLALLGIGVLLAPATLPTPLTLGAVVYFGALLIYGSALLVQESRRSTAIARRRTQAAALGSALLGLVIVFAGIRLAVPVPSAVTQVITLGSALAYAAAFAPPGFLRRSWREPGLRGFLARAAAIAPGAAIPEVVKELEAASAGVAGALAVRIQLDGDPSADPAAAGARTVIGAPLVTRGRVVGRLTAYLRRIPLFLRDEQETVEMLAQQSATVLDGASAYARLTETNERLESATRAKTEFLANMSHELRTPLNATLGFSDLLLEQLGPSLTPQQRRYFENIGNAGRHLLELINEVLDLTRVEAGRLELRSEFVPVAELIEPAVASTRTAARAREIDFQVELATDREVRVDPGRMRQVLYNLLSNAVKFTDRGGIVRLRVATEDRDLLFEVSDTGVGIPRDAHPRVFATFERLHESRPEATGTGLGLALTKRLVELHGGTIDFESEPGKGTIFRVRLPNAVAEPMRGRRVLIVEDDQRDSELVAALANAAGMRSEIVRTAAGARAAIRRDRPTAVVLDLRLPDERGERVLEELKADPATSHVPVIVVTVEDDEGRSRPLGAADHLTKPIDAERLGAWLRQVNGSA